MNIRPVSELTLYRYRYVIGYVLIALLIVGLLFWNVHLLPAGLSQAEEASALKSSRISMTINLENPFEGVLQFLQTTHAIDLPYHLLQKTSLNFLGVSPLGIRLPSLLLATMSAFLFLILLRRWLPGNTAIVMSVLIATSSWFLSIGRIGTPEIMVIFWAVLLLLLATLISQESRYVHVWKALSVFAVGLSFYSPYMVYLFLAIFIASTTQPHIRYIIRSIEKFSVTTALFIGAIVLVPLGFHAFREPSVLLSLLAMPTAIPGPLEFLQNLLSAGSALVNPFKNSITQSPLPLIGIPTTVLAIIGTVRLVKDWHAVRSHTLLLWLAILAPILALGGASQSLNILFAPIMLLAAIGMQSIFTYWYTIFPRNPYARVFGLVPLCVLVLSMINFNYQRYFVAAPSTPQSAVLYNQDAFILHDAISSKTYREQRLLIVAAPEKAELYSIDKQIVKNLEVVPTAQFTTTHNATSIIVVEDELGRLTPTQRGILPSAKTELLVNDRKENSLRFRVFSQ